MGIDDDGVHARTCVLHQVMKARGRCVCAWLVVVGVDNDGVHARVVCTK